MIKIIKALLSGKRKTVIILVFTLFIVMFSIHVNQSLYGFDQELALEIKEKQGAHTKIQFEDEYYGLEAVHKEITQILDSFKDQGINYKTSFSFKHFRQDIMAEIERIEDHGDISIGDEFSYLYDLAVIDVYELDPITKNSNQVLSGKDLEMLGDDEIAINKGFANILINQGIDPFDYSSDLLTDYSGQSLGLKPFRVVSIIDDLANIKISQTNEEIEAFPFFQNDTQEAGIYVNEAGFQKIIDSKVEDYKIRNLVFSDYIQLFESGYFEGEFDLEDSSTWPQALKDSIEFMKTDAFKERFMTKSFNLLYDTYSPQLEDKLQKTLETHVYEEGNFSRNYLRIHTLKDGLQKAPLMRSLLENLSTYLVLGVILTSFYSFYIYLKNQLRKSSHEISSLLIQGVSWLRIVSVYLLELMVIFSLSAGLIIVTKMVFTNFNWGIQVFSGSGLILLKTFGYSLLFIAAVALIVISHLYAYRKNSFKRFKEGFKTRIAWTGLSQRYFIKQMSLKRLFTYITSSLSFALSVAMVLLMMILSLAATYHIQKVYSKDTFGIHFDYMVVNSDLDKFYRMQDYVKDYAIIEKENNITFLEHDLWEGNSNFYKSSAITFYNNIKSFVDVEWGDYPPEPDYIFGENKYGFVETMVSRRHLDKRDANVSDKVTTSKNVENSYLFFYDPYSFYEGAYEIKGTINTLFNNGWTVYRYRLLDEKPINMKDFRINQYIVNLKDNVSPEEFELFLNENSMDFLSYEPLLESFQKTNDSMNATSLLVSSFVSIGMLLLLAMNLIGIQESVKMERQEDDDLLLRVGMSSSNVSRINRSVLVSRMLLSILFLLAIFLLVYPKFFNDLLRSFGLFSMPGSIMPTFIKVVTISSVGLILIYLLVSRMVTYQKK